MAVVEVHATGARFEGVEGELLTYYLGEAGTVGGYSIDGVAYPRKFDTDSGFDPAEHSVGEVQEHLANSTAAEQERVLTLEASSPSPRKSLVGEVVETADPSGAPQVQFDVPAGSAVVPDPEDPPADEPDAGA